MEQKSTIGNVCFIQHPSQEKILLLRRSKAPMKGKYTGVGGKTKYLEDIRTSCLREVFEETGLEVYNMELRGVVTTVQDQSWSSWILFVYCAIATEEQFGACNEGTLQWVDKVALDSVDLIGFIRPILSHVLKQASFFEGKLIHNSVGDIVIPKQTEEVSFI